MFVLARCNKLIFVQRGTLYICIQILLLTCVAVMHDQGCQRVLK